MDDPGEQRDVGRVRAVGHPRLQRRGRERAAAAAWGHAFGHPEIQKSHSRRVTGSQTARWPSGDGSLRVPAGSAPARTGSCPGTRRPCTRSCASGSPGWRPPRPSRSDEVRGSASGSASASRRSSRRSASGPPDSRGAASSRSSPVRKRLLGTRAAPGDSASPTSTSGSAAGSAPRERASALPQTRRSRPRTAPGRGSRHNDPDLPVRAAGGDEAQLRQAPAPTAGDAAPLAAHDLARDDLLDAQADALTAPAAGLADARDVHRGHARRLDRARRAKDEEPPRARGGDTRTTAPRGPARTTDSRAPCAAQPSSPFASRRSRSSRRRGRMPPADPHFGRPRHQCPARALKAPANAAVSRKG